MPFKTLADLQKGEALDEDPDNEYYAGGESSGQTIRGNPSLDRAGGAGPSRPRRSANRLVSAILERARQHSEGALPADAANTTHESVPFAGPGYRLGDADASGDNTEAQSSAPQVARTRVVTKTITFYRNGFVVDDGNLRTFDDPEQAAFLDDIHAGLVPRELEEPDLGELNVNLVDRSFEDYRPPSTMSSSSNRKPFEGGGYRLGESTDTSGSASPSVHSARVPYPDGVVQPDDLDPNAPTTQVQVRLADGTRMVTRMNTTHRIRDLRRLVCSQRTEYADRAFVFQTVVPRRPLEEESLSLAEANLLNAVVMQQLQPQ